MILREPESAPKLERFVQRSVGMPVAGLTIATKSSPHAYQPDFVILIEP